MNPESKARDVVVIGGGPAGLAASIALSRKGFRVVVVDRAHGPIDKVCGEGVMPDGIAALDRLGVTIPPEESFPFRGIRFLQGEISAEAFFPGRIGLGVRRTALHEALIENAAEAGVEILWGTKVSGIVPGEVTLGAYSIRCRLVVGADGQNSRVRKWADLDHARFSRIRFGCRQHFEVPPWTDMVEVYWGDKFQLVVTPVGPRVVCAALTSTHPRMRLANAITALPRLAERLEGAAPPSGEKGAASVSRVLRSASGDRLALVGDASGSVDSLTGEGLSLAFKQALALADAMSRGTLSGYAAAHRRIAATPVLMSKLLLVMDRYTLVRRPVLRILAREPHIFTRLLAANVRESI